MGKQAKNERAELQSVQLEVLLGIEEVMAILGLSRPMVYKLIREEGLPTMRSLSRSGNCKEGAI